MELSAGEEKHVSINLTELKTHLWVETIPPDAKVAFLNLDTDFTQGLELEWVGRTGSQPRRDLNLPGSG